ncbi:Protein of unknown function [Gryllus bimaculatus]|nr:Protein of unknown function [Gryllus bimaculatus]
MSGRRIHEASEAGDKTVKKSSSRLRQQKDRDQADEEKKETKEKEKKNEGRQEEPLLNLLQHRHHRRLKR